MLKWNYKTRQYDPYYGPEGAIVYSDDMDRECECAQCGKKIKFGEGYTSFEIHNTFGFGYCVCEECKNLEILRKLEARKANDEQIDK